jgi:hypothetical protein
MCVFLSCVNWGCFRGDVCVCVCVCTHTFEAPDIVPGDVGHFDDGLTEGGGVGDAQGAVRVCVCVCGCVCVCEWVWVSGWVKEKKCTRTAKHQMSCVRACMCVCVPSTINGTKYLCVCVCACVCNLLFEVLLGDGHGV